MANDGNTDGKPYEKARDLTEKALEAYVNDDDSQGDKLIKQAKAVNQNAVEDVNKDLEEDASSEHDPAKLNDQIAKQRD
ncbi:hypothetical protein [Rhodopila sp.]|uniref:hypothetical protein n=1 Tax=Rhodopila sp. TaxID=2480087 RepID=UPI003D09A187